MKSFFLKKMNLEFSELMKGKAARKLIEQITIEELALGTSLPVIKGALHLVCTFVNSFLTFPVTTKKCASIKARYMYSSFGILAGRD